MNFILWLLFLVLFLNECCGVIYYLNETEFNRMPPLYKVDGYDSCLKEDDGVYCSLNFDLVADEPNELLQMIEEYSEQTLTHFNHSKLRHGVCVTQSCQHYIENKTSVSEANLEGCLNQTFWREYKLKTKLQRYSCYNSSDSLEIDIGDIIAGIVVIGILMLNIVGSFYDFCKASKDHEDKPFLLSFSIKRNWKKLISTSGVREERLKRFKGLNGLRCLISYGVVLVHSVWPYATLSENIHDLEMSYYQLPNYLLFNGSIVIQLFLIMSAMLLSYKMEVIAEKIKISWSLIPSAILKRYLRLTPVYAFVIMLLSTWFKFIGPGPFWEASGGLILSDCRRRWWLSLLYLNNYVHNHQCLMVYWYLATDMQLFCFGVMVCVVLKKTRFRKLILSLLLVISIIIPAVHTYIRDLHGMFLIYPSGASSLFDYDPTFNEIYKTAHGNMSGYVIGLFLGYLVYDYQKKEIDIKKYSKWRYIYWFLVPLIFSILLSTSVFYRDAPRDPLYVRVLCAAFIKPIAGLLMAIFLAGMIFKLECIYRKFLEWNIWAIPSKLTYIVYIIHLIFIVVYINMHSSLIWMSVHGLIICSLCVTIVSYVAAIPLYLLVEAPFADLTKKLTQRPSKE